MSADPSPDKLLTRRQLSEALTARGYSISPRTLANLVSQGAGPPHARWGRGSLYRWGEALRWAETRRTVTPAAAARRVAVAA